MTSGVDKWTPELVLAEARNKMHTGMQKAVLYAKGKAMRSINRGNATGRNPSLPGEPPKKVSARLFLSIATEVIMGEYSVIGRYGTNVVYARRLELGFVGTDSAGRTFNQAPRPFLRPILKNEASKLVRIIVGG